MSVLRRPCKLVTEPRAVAQKGRVPCERPQGHRGAQGAPGQVIGPTCETASREQLSLNLGSGWPGASLKADLVLRGPACAPATLAEAELACGPQATSETGVFVPPAPVLLSPHLQELRSEPNRAPHCSPTSRLPPGVPHHPRWESRPHPGGLCSLGYEGPPLPASQGP